MLGVLSVCLWTFGCAKDGALPPTPSQTLKTLDNNPLSRHARPVVKSVKIASRERIKNPRLAVQSKVAQAKTITQNVKKLTIPPDGPCRPDFVSVFQAVSPSTLGVAAGQMVDGRFQATRSGSGFTWDVRDHVVTNAHLVAEASVVRIRSRDGRVLRARIIGLDAGTDLAVLHVEGLGLAPLKRGKLAHLKPGQWVAAVGNPYGMDHSITVGVISAVGRRNLPGHAAKYAEFIQTDVSIFPGNSGGPLVDIEGRVIGLNTAKLGEGLSFSTHIDMVTTVVERLVEHGRFDRGFAGLYLKPVSFKKAEQAGLGTRKGAVIRALVGDGPADLAGMVPGDIILTIGHQQIEQPGAVPWLIAATPPGTTIPVTVVREHERLTFQLTIGAAP
jgi:serine protease Do